MNAKKAFSKLEVIQHIRDENPYPEFTLFIDYRQRLSLQELYYCLCKEKDSRASQVRRQILKYPIRRLRTPPAKITSTGEIEQRFR